MPTLARSGFPGADHRRELAVLRTRLLPSLVEVARRNLEVGNERIALFEIARVYFRRARESCRRNGRTPLRSPREASSG